MNPLHRKCKQLNGDLMFNVEFITLHYSLYQPLNYCTCRQQVCAGGRDILNFFPLPVTGSLRWTMIHNQHQDHYPASRGLFLESSLFLDPPDWSRKIEETSGRRVYTQDYFLVFYHHPQKNIESPPWGLYSITLLQVAFITQLEINFSETVETALSKLFSAVKEGAITEYMCSTLQRSDIHAC